MIKERAMLIIDYDYKVLYVNKGFASMYPDIRVGEKCFKENSGNPDTCDFPLLLSEEKSRFFYNPVRREWVRSEYMDMEYEGKPAFCIFTTRWEDKRDKNDTQYDIENVKELEAFKEFNKGNATMFQGFGQQIPILEASKECLKLLDFNDFNDLLASCNGIVTNLIHKDDLEDALTNLDHAIYPGTSFSTAFRLKRSNGTFIWVLATGVVLNDKNGKPIIASVFRDMDLIAELKEGIKKESKLLIEQNQKLMFMTNDQPSAYCRCEDDLEYTFIDISLQLCKLIGFSKREIEESFNNKFINLVYPDDLNDYLDAFNNDNEVDDVVEHVYRLKHKTKGFIWIKDVSKYGSYNNKRFIHCSLLDITKEYNQQLMLENRNKQLEIINGLVPGGFKITNNDKDYSFAYVSKEAAALFGYTPEEFIEANRGSNFCAVYYEDIDSCFKQFRDTKKNNNGQFSIKYRIKCKDGSLKSIIDSGKVIKDENGNETFYSFFLDITKDEERENLINLQKNNLDQLRLIHALSKEFIVVYHINLQDDSINLIYVDSIAEKYIGAYNQSFSGYYDRLEFYLASFIKDEDRLDLRRKVQLNNVAAELASKDSYIINYHISVMGLVQYYQVKYVRISKNDPNEIIMGIRSLDKENDQFIKEQRVLSEKLEDAKEASKAKTVFLNSMSHDIRTPMNAIIGFTNLAKKYIDDKDVALEYLRKISKSSEHLMSLINDILDMSRIEAGKIKIDLKPVNIADLIHNVKSMIQLDVKQKGIGFFVDNINIKHEDIMCDSIRLSQVLLNLLSNSIKFTPSGGTIKLVLHEDYDPSITNRSKYTIIVKDSGIGMSKEFMETIFEPFARERTSTVSGIQGTGLGMSIAKSIVDLLGGTISVESEQGVGTEFTIKLDLEINRVIPRFDVNINTGKRALVIDDNTRLCHDMVNKLDKLGFVSEYVTDPIKALDMAREAKRNKVDYNLYLVDWIMPNLNGVAVCKQIRDEISKDALVLLASTYDLSEVEVEAKKAGVNYFVAKPVFLTDLKSILTKEYTEAEIVEEENPIERFKGKRILLAEDNAFNQEIAVQILTDAGFNVEVAGDGRAALDMLLEHVDEYYDLILMDIQMPILDGYQATKLIRRLPNERLKNIPIVAMSANVFDENIKASQEVGMNAHLAKPINIDKLIETLNKIID